MRKEKLKALIEKASDEIDTIIDFKKAVLSLIDEHVEDNEKQVNINISSSWATEEGSEHARKNIAESVNKTFTKIFAETMNNMLLSEPRADNGKPKKREQVTMNVVSSMETILNHSAK